MTSSSGLEQDQFLTILSREEALARFEAALDLEPLGRERVPLGDLVGRVLAKTVEASVDTPPFDRSVVDGFALLASDVVAASDSIPTLLTLNGEYIACGHQPAIRLLPGTATPIATGGPVPRGADAVVMMEHTSLAPEGALLVGRAIGAGQNVAFAGSDIARGEVLLRRGTVLGSREIGMLAAVGLAEVEVFRRPRIAVISTGDELVPPGEALRPATLYDSNGAIIAAALQENGCKPVPYGAIPDNLEKLSAIIQAAHAACDGVILSGGTSKGAGDLTYRIVAALGQPGIVAHGVALKPGKPLCLAVCGGKPVVVLPGFPTSAMFTFHDMIAPVLRKLAGQPERETARLPATLAVRIASEMGRTEFVMVSLSDGPDGPVAYPVGKGSGSVTAFSQADGFVTVPALDSEVPARAPVAVTLFAAGQKAPALMIMGSHCVGLDAVITHLATTGITVRSAALGSLGGLAALRRGECDIAPIHLLDPATGHYNTPFISDGMRIIPGWKRMQGVVFRPDDLRFGGMETAEALVALALREQDCLMVNRNQGSGTRVLIDGLLAGLRPPGHSNQPRSHNAVAVAIGQKRADWGIAIEPVAQALGLRFLPLAQEHYEFAVSVQPRHPERISAFERAVAVCGPELMALGFAPAVPLG